MWPTPKQERLTLLQDTSATLQHDKELWTPGHAKCAVLAHQHSARVNINSRNGESYAGTYSRARARQQRRVLQVLATSGARANLGTPTPLTDAAQAHPATPVRPHHAPLTSRSDCIAARTRSRSPCVPAARVVRAPAFRPPSFGLGKRVRRGKSPLFTYRPSKA